MNTLEGTDYILGNYIELIYIISIYNHHDVE